MIQHRYIIEADGDIMRKNGSQNKRFDNGENLEGLPVSKGRGMYEEKHYGTWETLIVPEIFFRVKKGTKRSEPAESEIPALYGSPAVQLSLRKEAETQTIKDGRYGGNIR